MKKITIATISLKMLCVVGFAYSVHQSASDGKLNLSPEYEVASVSNGPVIYGSASL